MSNTMYPTNTPPHTHPNILFCQGAGWPGQTLSSILCGTLEFLNIKYLK